VTLYDRYRWYIHLGIALLAASVVLYLLHFLIFTDAHHILIYLLGDIAFIPIEVLVVTIIIHQLLNRREKRQMLEKLNMLIGAFFSEVGTVLLTYFSDFDPQLENIRSYLLIDGDWTNERFERTSRQLQTHPYAINQEKMALAELQKTLKEKRDFLARLLENPNLLEHETFTKLLRAVFHLAEELDSRDDLTVLPTSDREHLTNDIKRAYVLIVHEWLDYMHYLKDHYPYLFSLAMRTNPFDRNASPVVR
jgi:hypothetical protein